MGTLSFTKEAAQELARTYAMPDMVAQREAVMELLSLKPGEKVIDIGCGPGYLCEELANATGSTGRVLGIDISADLIALCESRNTPDHLDYKVADALALPVPDASCDVAVCTQVAEYIPDTERLLNEIARVLTPGGRLLVMATDWDCVAWHSDEPTRMREVMTLWEGHCAHPRMPRTLRHDLVSATMAVKRVCAHPLFNLDFGEERYSNGVAKLICAYCKKQGMPVDLADAWFDELRQLDAADRYYFMSARMIFIAEKE